MPSPQVLLLTDIVDSTLITQQLGDAQASALWQAHDRQARALLAPWRGREIDKSDGLLLLFGTVDDAVGYAQDYHDALAQLQPPLRSRVGIHTGNLWLRENPAAEVALGAKPLEVDGLAKAVAARVMSVAVGGQTLLSDTAHIAWQEATDRASDLAGRGVPRACGHWRLKGVPEPLAVWAVGAGAGAGELPQDSAKAWRVVRQGDLWLPVQQLPHSLPAERDRFFGRGAALKRLDQLIGQGARLVSVLGMGGMGKTRLSQHFGWRSMGEHAGGIWFCDLSAAQSVDGLVHAVAQGLALPLTGADPVTQIGQAIAGRGDCLVILDNFEQITRLAPATLGRWLDAAPSARFVVTSREVLGLPGEQVLVLEPLDAAEGAQLFVSRAESATGLPVAGTPAAVLDELVGMLDGMPLALELAASRARLMSPEEMLRRMGERFKLLTSRGGRPDRQATLRGALDWSWDLLTESERSVLAQVAAFEGGFTLDAAEQVCCLPDGDAQAWIADLLAALVDKSLLRRISAQRFRLLRTLQDYGRDRLGSAIDVFRQRHAAYYGRSSAPSSLAESVADFDNVVAALRWVSSRATADAQAGAERDALAIELVQRAWSALRLTGPFQAAIEWCEPLRTRVDLAPQQRARLLRVLAGANSLLGRSADAVSDFELAIACATAAGDVGYRAVVQCLLADEHLRSGRVAEAEAVLCDVRAMPSPSDEVLMLLANTEGLLALGRTNYDKAEASFDLALHQSRRLKDRRWEGGVLGNLGRLAILSGRFQVAHERLDAAIACAADLGDKQWEGNARCNLGYLLYEQGQLDEAAQHLTQSLAVARMIGHRWLETIALCNLGLVNGSRGRHGDAVAQLTEAVRVAGALGSPATEGQFRGYLGLALSRAGEIQQSLEMFQTALSQLSDADHALERALVRSQWAIALAGAGRLDEARSSLEAAQRVAIEMNIQAGSELARSIVIAQAAVN